MTKIVELFGVSTTTGARPRWDTITRERRCPFLDRPCLKNRKSNPEILIGTCTVQYGRQAQPIIICPHRMLKRGQVFSDCLQLLTLHEPGNEFHVVPEITLPGGSVDYFLASVNRGKVKDFVGIELQTLDTTGTVWPERQRFLQQVGVPVRTKDVQSVGSFGMNWKMTAKTILVQLHHKIETFETINKHLVLVIQDHLLTYIRKNFDFAHVRDAKIGDSFHLHSYHLGPVNSGEWRLELSERLSTDVAGVQRALGLQSHAKVELATIVAQLEAKLSDATLFKLGSI